MKLTPDKRPYPVQSTLKGLRAKCGFSQEYMAEFLEISGTNYHQKENGYLQFKLDEGFKISKLFNMNMHDVIIFFDHDVSKRKQGEAIDGETDDDSQASC